MSRRGPVGQASVEALAAIPVVVVAVLVSWQLALLVRGAIVAQDRLRTDAAAAAGSGTITVTSTVAVTSLIPGTAAIRIPAWAVVAGP